MPSRFAQAHTGVLTRNRSSFPMQQSQCPRPLRRGLGMGCLSAKGEASQESCPVLWGYLVIAGRYGVQAEADNGREALEMAIKSQPDAVGLRSYTFGALTVSSARAHSA